MNPLTKTVTVPVAVDLGPLAQQLRDAADLLDPRPVDPSKVTVDREDLAVLLEEGWGVQNERAFQARRRIRAAFEAQALGVVSPDPTSDEADRVSSPYTDDQGDLNAAGEAYLARAAERIAAVRPSPDPTSDEPDYCECGHRRDFHDAYGVCVAPLCRCITFRPNAPAPSPVAAEAAPTRCPAFDGLWKCSANIGHQGAHFDVEANVVFAAPLTAQGSGVAAEAAPPQPTAWGNSVSGRCPACGSSSTLFVAVGGHVTCSLDVCPNPTAVADALLDGKPLWALGEGQAIVNIEAVVHGMAEHMRDRGCTGEWPGAITAAVLSLRAALAAASEATP